MRYPFRLLSLVIATATLLSAVERPSMARSFAAQRRVAAETKQADESSVVLFEVEGVLEEGDRALENGSLYDIHPFEAQAGQSITIRLESNDFDTLLGLIDAERQVIAWNDNFNTSETHSQLTVTFPSTGLYRVVADSASIDARGRYQITVTEATDTEISLAEAQAEADRLLQQGIQQSRDGQFREALQTWEQSLNVYRELGNRLGETNSLGNLGNVYSSLGQYQQAIDFHQQSLDVAREIGNRQGEASVLGGLGNVYASLGQYQQAIDFHQQSLDLSNAIGDRLEFAK